MNVRLRVVGRRAVTPDVIELELAHADGASLAPWTPGSHIEISTPAGPRQYSLCGATNDDTWRIGVLREDAGRGGSAWMHESASVGIILDVEGPRNHFPLRDAPEYLFMAGGIGITPLLAMIEEATGRSVPYRLVYGGRSLATMAYLDRLNRLANSPEVLDLVPFDERGLPDIDAALSTLPAGGAIYACGPAAMLDALQAASSHLPAGTLNVERFEPVMVDTSGDQPFTVELKLSGVTIEVSSDESIIECAERAGVFVPSSCQSGTCGTCETRVIDGTPEHRDAVLSPEDQASNEYMMICVSRARTRTLSLEL